MNNAIRKATESQLNYIESLAQEAGYADGSAAWIELKKVIDRAAKSQPYEDLTLRQASVLIDLLDEKAEELAIQKQEEAQAHEKFKKDMQELAGLAFIFAVIALVVYLNWD